MQEKGKYFPIKDRTHVVKRGNFMSLAEAIKTKEDSYTVENAMNALLTKLDEALDDVEHGRVLDETDLWTEIDAIQE